MAETTIKTVVELEKLGLYDELIKEYIAAEDAKSLKTVAISGNVVNFYRSEEPLEEDATPAYSIELPETDISGLIEKMEGATAGNVVVANADGTVADGGVALADLAKTADVEKAIEDAAYDDTNVKADIQANADAIAAINNEESGILAQAQTYADGKDEAIKAAKDAADTAQGEVDALEEVVAGMYSNTQIDKAIETAKTEVAYDDEEVRGLIDDNSIAITTVASTVGNMYTNDQIDAAIAMAVAGAGHLKREIIEALPDIPDPDENIIYMVSVEDGSGNQMYEEFMLINGVFEKIGDSKVSLEGYATTDDVATAKQESIDTAASDATSKADAALASAKTYTDEQIAAIDLSGIETNADDIDALEASLAEGGATYTSIANAQADATSALEQIAAIEFATEDDIRAMFQ